MNNNSNSNSFRNEDEIDIDELEFNTNNNNNNNNNFQYNQDACFSPIISDNEDNYSNQNTAFLPNFADSSDDLDIIDGKVVHLSRSNEQKSVEFYDNNIGDSKVIKEEIKHSVASDGNDNYQTVEAEIKNEELDIQVKVDSESKEESNSNMNTDNETNNQAKSNSEAKEEEEEEDDFMNAAQDVQYDSDVPDLPPIDAKSSSESESDSDESVGIEDLEDFDEGPKPTQPILSENESKIVLAPELPLEPLPLDTPIHPLGVIYSNKSLNTNTTTLVIKSSPQFNHFALDLDSTLVLNDLTILGTVHETFGPVQDPWYSVLIQSTRASQFPEGSEVYFVLNLSKPVEIQQLKKIKGSDASNLYDEEVGEHELEFSDDEEEQNYKKQRRELGKVKWIMKKQQQQQQQQQGDEKSTNQSNNNGGDGSAEGGQRGERRLRVYDL